MELSARSPVADIAPPLPTLTPDPPWSTLWQMRLLASIFATVVLLTEVYSPAPAQAQAPRKDVQLIEGSARIRRGRVRRARGAATHQALLTAVWRWIKPQLASAKGHARLKRRLSRRVRRLIKRYRTRKVSRGRRRLTVLLAVTVDKPAVRARLKALKVQLKKPGVLLVGHCDDGSLEPSLARGLRSVAIRVVKGPWPVEKRAAMVQIARSQPAVVRTWARAAHASVVLVARCERSTLSTIVAASVTGVRAKLVVKAYAPDGPTGVRRLLHLEQTGLGHHADPKQAGPLAFSQAVRKLAPRLGRGLAPQLPEGLTRTLLVRLRGPMALATLLQLTRSMSAQLQGVHGVKPQQFQRGSTWLAIQTIYDPSRLQTFLTTVIPPPGWLLKVSQGPLPGTLDVTVEATEDP